MSDPWENKNRMTNKPKIAIAVPYVWNWPPEWVDKTYVPLRYVATEFCDKYPFLCKVPSVGVARDILVNSALKANVDYLFFLDTDLIFESPTDPNKALEMLYQCMKNNKDTKIVSGLYRAKQSVGFNYAMWLKAPNNVKGYTPVQSWSGNWLDVDVTGLGCTLIDMEVFKNMKRPWFKWELQEDQSEDFYFFQLAKQHGYKTNVITDVKLSHLGGLKVKCDGSIVTQEM